MILAETSRERSRRKKWKLQATEKCTWELEMALKDLVTRKSGKDRKDPGQPPVEIKVSRTKKPKRGRSIETK